MTFYNKKSNLKTFVYYVSKQSNISLRVFDFLCTKYLKTNNVVYYIDKKGKKVPFNLNVEYKAQLKAYSKLQFDPFKRHERITITVDKNKELITTIGQMNFFRFAIENKLTDWLEKSDNLKHVESCINEKTSPVVKKVKQTKNVSTSKHNYHITVSFG